jgi:hypothetical protein
VGRVTRPLLTSGWRPDGIHYPRGTEQSRETPEKTGIPGTARTETRTLPGDSASCGPVPKGTPAPAAAPPGSSPLEQLAQAIAALSADDRAGLVKMLAGGGKGAGQ